MEFVTEATTYQKKMTIGSVEVILAGGTFVRIHRSILINKEKVLAVTGPTKEQYWITLLGEHEVRSSRSYKSVIENLIPKAK